MTEVEKILAIEEIKLLKARYFRFVDTKDWDGFAALFTDDAIFDISEDVPGGIFEGPEKIVEPASAGLVDCVSVHHGHCPEITLTSEVSAEGVWAMEDMLRWKDGAASPIHSLHGYGHYFETYRKLNGKWRIQTLKLSRLRVDITQWHTK